MYIYIYIYHLQLQYYSFVEPWRPISLDIINLFAFFYRTKKYLEKQRFPEHYSHHNEARLHHPEAFLGTC